MVWDRILSKGHWDLAFIEDTLDAGQYLRILKTYLISSAVQCGGQCSGIEDDL